MVEMSVSGFVAIVSYNMSLYYERKPVYLEGTRRAWEDHANSTQTKGNIQALNPEGAKLQC